MTPSATEGGIACFAVPGGDREQRHGARSRDCAASEATREMPWNPKNFHIRLTLTMCLVLPVEEASAGRSCHVTNSHDCAGVGGSGWRLVSRMRRDPPDTANTESPAATSAKPGDAPEHSRGRPDLGSTRYSS